MRTAVNYIILRYIHVIRALLFLLPPPLPPSPQSINSQDASLADLQEAFYDHFNVSLTAVQLIVAGAGDDWQSARRAASSPYHILHPLGFDVQLKKSLLPNDTNLPRYIFMTILFVLIALNAV